LFFFPGIVPPAPGSLTPSALGCEFGYRPWIARDEHVRTLTGTLRKFRYYHGLEDKDANFFIEPGGDSKHLAMRTDGTPNEPIEGLPAGMIEAEVWTDRSILSDLFLAPTGVFSAPLSVRARGWWVEDIWHGYKTELHPLRSLVGVKGDDTVVFISHEWSKPSRFCVDANSLDEAVSLSTMASADARTIETNATHSDPVEATLESAVLDVGTGRKRSSMSVSQHVNPDGGGSSLNIGVHFDPVSPDEYRPLYLAHFRKDKSARFDDSVALSIQPNPTGSSANCKALQMDLSGAFTLPSGLPALTHWNWQVEPGALNGTSSSFAGSLVYSPCAGQNNTSWTLVGTAATGAPDFLPPRGAPGDPGRQEFAAKVNTRTFVSKLRKYSVEPSRGHITLNETAPAPAATPTSAPGAFARWHWSCGGKTELTAHSVLAPLQVESNFRWVLPAPSQGSQTLTLNAASPQAAGSGFSASLDASDPHRMTVSWDVANYNYVGSQGQPIPSLSNFPVPVRRSIQAHFETEIGEQPVAQVFASPPCGPASGSRSLLETIKDMFKLELALRKLGVNDFPTTIGAGLPSRIRILTLADVRRLPTDRRLGDLSKRNSRLVQTMIMARNGKLPNNTDFHDLVAALNIAARIQWDPKVTTRDVESALLNRGIDIR